MVWLGVSREMIAVLVAEALLLLSLVALRADYSALGWLAVFCGAATALLGFVYRRLPDERKGLKRPLNHALFAFGIGAAAAVAISRIVADSSTPRSFDQHVFARCLPTQTGESRPSLLILRTTDDPDAREGQRQITEGFEAAGWRMAGDFYGPEQMAGNPGDPHLGRGGLTWLRTAPTPRSPDLAIPEYEHLMAKRAELERQIRCLLEATLEPFEEKAPGGTAPNDFLGYIYIGPRLR